ncbi:unnamed protein product [Spirodela intermedia]|uniref:Hydrophobic seed protein domain-containing protein n=1 Tax=Spirodela intermedia TaxID=51605 RepID=A0A7I8IJJ9_SPIIN|nr:unnamed protein product [Spirodela intermedia]CAA6658018.1 unnamed protein product [Spirodela intermedia]
MAAKMTATTAVFLILNLLFVTLASSQSEGPLSPPPTESPSAPVVAVLTPPATSPIESSPSIPLAPSLPPSSLPLVVPPSAPPVVPPSTPPVVPPSTPPVVPPSTPPVVPPSALSVVPPSTPPVGPPSTPRVVPPSTPPVVPPSTPPVVPPSTPPVVPVCFAKPDPLQKTLGYRKSQEEGIGITIIDQKKKWACCLLIDRLSNQQATACLCAAARSRFLGLNLWILEDVALLLNFCGRAVPPGLTCP